VRVKCTNCRDFFPKGTEWWSNNMQRICSEECFNEWTESRRRKARERKPNRKRYSAKKQARMIPPELRHHIVDRDVFCRVCGHRGQEVHHVTFRSQGGKNEMSNLILLCTTCHHTKAHGPDARKYAQLFRAHIWLTYLRGRTLPWETMIRRYGWMVDPELPEDEKVYIETADETLDRILSIK
jgi:5-methylcytosine-specific restriction endonuclease McrA